MDYFNNLVSNKTYSIHKDETSFRNWFLEEVTKNYEFFLDKKILLFLPKESKNEIFITGGKIFATEQEYLNEIYKSVAPFGMGGKFIGFINDEERAGVIKFGVNLDDQAITYRININAPQKVTVVNFQILKKPEETTHVELSPQSLIFSILDQFRNENTNLKN